MGLPVLIAHVYDMILFLVLIIHDATYQVHIIFAARDRNDERSLADGWLAWSVYGVCVDIFFSNKCVCKLNTGKTSTVSVRCRRSLLTRLVDSPPLAPAPPGHKNASDRSRLRWHAKGLVFNVLIATWLDYTHMVEIYLKYCLAEFYTSTGIHGGK